jgi:hypothetical protein
MANNTYTLVSTLSSGAQLTGGDSGTTESFDSVGRLNIAVSGNGRYIAFTSGATNFPDDSDTAGWDVYHKDTLTGALSLVSVSATGANSASSAGVFSISDDGNWVLFGSSATNLGNFGPSPVVNASVYLKNMSTGEVFDIVPEKTPMVANSKGSDADMSSDARFVVFASTETNITGETVSGNQIFRVDRQDGSVTMVSKSATGVQLGSGSDDPHISNDGRYVIFQTKAKAVAADLNTAYDIYLKDTQTGELRLISVGLDGKAAGGENAQISGNGRYVSFISAGDFTNPDPGNDAVLTSQAIKAVYRADLQTGEIVLASIGADGTLPNRYSLSATISDDGRYVLFRTAANTFDGVPGLTYQGTLPTYASADPGVWLKDMVTGALTPIDANGNLSNSLTNTLTLSGDGTLAVFGLDTVTTWLPPILPAGTDTNGKGDVFTALTGVAPAGMVVPGTPGNDVLQGSAGDDTLTTGLGNDTVNAGAGVDTVILPMFPNVFNLGELTPGQVSGSYAGYSLSLNDVEFVQFGAESRTTLPLSTLVSGEAQLQLGRLTDLYLAFFGRAPDVGGLEYWQERLLEEGRDFATISKDFAWSTESQALYPVGGSNREFVRTVYLNCFARQPDAGGWDYWTGRLDGLGVTDLNDRGAFVGEVILGAYATSSGPEDRALLTNRHEAAMYYANKLAVAPAEGFDAAINTLLTRVTGDAATEDKAEDVIDHVFANPVTLTGVMANQALLDSIWGA